MINFFSGHFSCSNSVQFLRTSLEHFFLFVYKEKKNYENSNIPKKCCDTNPEKGLKRDSFFCASAFLRDFSSG